MKNKLVFTVLSLMLYCSYALGQESAPAVVNAPYAGATITDFKGKISIQLPSQKLSAPSRGEVLPPETTVNTNDGRLLLHLSDGSDILVRPNTRLVLKQPETSGWKYFQILIGRVRTQIQKHLNGTPAFQIGTPSAVISVRGTKFNVEVDRRGFTEVDVDEGVVELEATSGQGESVLITAGFSSRVGMETGPEVPRPTQDLRPQLDRPSRKDEKGIGGDDDDSMKKLLASDHNSNSGDHHNGGGNDGPGSSNGNSSSGGSDNSGNSNSGSSGSSGSDGDRSSGSDDHDHGDDHRHGGGKPPGFFDLQ
ncbi:MAG TPA: FecR family protein [Candidatus Angelobacter sp.]|nr:FecR family protein [Candidatus Angelobacter sp.]